MRSRDREREREKGGRRSGGGSLDKGDMKNAR